MLFRSKLFNVYHHHHDLVLLTARSPLALSLSLPHCPSLSPITSGRSCRKHPQSAQSRSICWSACRLGKSPEKNAWPSSAVPSMFCSFYIDGLWDVSQVAVPLLFYGVLLPGFVQNSIFHFCVVLIGLNVIRFDACTSTIKNKK